ncbi:MAG TPA: ATP-dependent DNA helicase RecG [Lachnospiraceae bacterium]|nr:ATP-dependent DNA helicase RecG [Lachnospiraceae bacterium]
MGTEIQQAEQAERDELLCELRECYGPDAVFRDGQEEAVLGILNGRRTLVVQKTGWGKSLVYFLATKMLRKRSDAVTLIISPLLALMNNQIESANRLGLQVKTINSENTEEWDEIFEAFQKHTLDALIISPERLANEDFKKMLTARRGADIGLFVVDEAHCISDWGHDFRPDYRRIVDIIQMLPSNIPVLATTATANNRVVSDIRKQLGDDLLISRGSLMRESLALQAIKLGSKEERLAWISEHIDSIPGSGIIYCRTVSDCQLVCRWLVAEGISAECYYAGVEKKEGKAKQEIIDRFMGNQIKALVATVAFGMGFDKPDISFVIHFQRPGNIVAYYQQIGRAGRAMDHAYAILLCGEEDDAISNYFINSAFPTEDQMNEIVKAVTDHPGLRLKEFERYVNMKATRIQKCVNYLMVNGDIYRDRNQYYKTPRAWQPDLEHCEEITGIRKAELRQMNDFSNLTGCYMEYIARFLDDAQADRCGKCANCLGHPLFSEEVSREKVAQAQQFIRSSFNVIEPRKVWPAGVRVDGRNVIEEADQCGEGRVLSNYGDAGWGMLVQEGKYRQNHFGSQLVDASCELLKDYVRENEIRWVTNISSRRRPDLVRDFAKALAEKLGLEYADVIRKTENARCQKELNTSILQFENADSSFEAEYALEGNVLLVDDMVDSRWTLTVCGYKLRKKGSGKVFPFALANTADRNGDE